MSGVVKKKNVVKKKKRAPHWRPLRKLCPSASRFPLPASRDSYSPIAMSLLSNPYLAGSFEMRAAAIIIGT